MVMFTDGTGLKSCIQTLDRSPATNRQIAGYPLTDLSIASGKIDCREIKSTAEVPASVVARRSSGIDNDHPSCPISGY
jgi:hypothetical protein